MSHSATIATYDARAGEYARLAGSLSELPELEAFAALLPEGGRVLDLGCGPGHYAGWLAARGFRTDAVDASGEMVALAAAREGVNAWQARFEEIGGQAVYHGIWANFALLHLPHAEMPSQMRRLKRALIPGGILHLGMKLGAGEATDRLGRFYAYWSEDALEALLVDAGFAITHRRQGRGAGLAGTDEPHILIRAHG